MLPAAEGRRPAANLLLWVGSLQVQRQILVRRRRLDSPARPVATTDPDCPVQEHVGGLVVPDLPDVLGLLAAVEERLSIGFEY
jgi:hypothetical protein